MQRKRYYRVVLSYGHVGRRKEISVARYIEVLNNQGILDVYKLVNAMPGTKNNAVRILQPITYFQYVKGKQQEKNNFYIKKLRGAI